MQCKYFSKLAVCGFLAIALVGTSFGGGLVAAAYAATPEAPETTKVEESGSGAVGGLVALGLLAAIAGNKKQGQSAGDKPPVSGSNSGSSTSAPKPDQAPVSSGTVKAAEQRAFDLLNKDRQANGLPALKLNGALVVLAENYAQDMINRKFFSHYNPEGQSPFDRMRQSGISYRSAGENIAINTSVDGAQKAFMNSSGHRANILNSNYTEVGIGVRYDAKGSVYVVQEFIGR